MKFHDNSKTVYTVLIQAYAVKYNARFLYYRHLEILLCCKVS